MKKLIPLLSVCLLSLAAVAARSPSSPFFQMRLVLDAPSADSEQMVLVQPGKNSAPKETLYVQKTVLLDQTALKSAVTTRGADGSPRIAITFTDAGTKRFAEMTRQCVGKRLAVVIDGRLYSAPKIRMEIPGGKAEINGSFSEEEARSLAAKITEALQRR